MNEGAVPKKQTPCQSLNFQKTAYSGIKFIYLFVCFDFFPSPSCFFLSLASLLGCFNHIMLSTRVRGGGASFF